MYENESRNILVIDDNPDNLTLLAELLTEHHYKVRLATNGARGLATSRKEAPDLVLLDIVMPDMDGFEVCRKLKENEQTASIPIIFISALNETIDKVKAFSVGGVDFVTKPFEAEEVLARVKTHLTLYFLQRELEQKNEELQKALDEIDTLREILPICSFCKNIRNDEGYYEQIDAYFHKHSAVNFSHTICPSCMAKHYPNFMGKNSK